MGGRGAEIGYFDEVKMFYLKLKMFIIERKRLKTLKLKYIHLPSAFVVFLQEIDCLVVRKR